MAYTHRPVHGTTARVLPVSGFTTMTRLVLSSLLKRSKVILFPSGDHAGTLSLQPLGVGDLADVASVGVHREESALGLIRIEVAPKDDLTVPGRATARALVVVLFVIAFATCQRRESHAYHH